jgi:hypothetical protein
MRGRKGPIRGPWYTDGVVVEAESLLRGDVAGAFQRQQDAVPPWAWINFLAHASLAGLTHVLANHPDENSLSDWGLAVHRLSSALVAMSSDEASLRDIQCQCLVPLELAVLSGTTVVPRAEDLRAAVQAALDKLTA